MPISKEVEAQLKVMKGLAGIKSPRSKELFWKTWKIFGLGNLNSGLPLKDDTEGSVAMKVMGELSESQPDILEDPDVLNQLVPLVERDLGNVLSKLKLR